jgi:hypothetical protein
MERMRTQKERESLGERVRSLRAHSKSSTKDFSTSSEFESKSFGEPVQNGRDEKVNHQELIHLRRWMAG